MMIIMSVVYLDLVRHGTSSLHYEANLFLIDSDMTMSMPVIMSMSMTVPVVVMTTCRVHSKQIDCQSNTAHPKQSVDSHELRWIHAISSALVRDHRENSAYTRCIASNMIKTDIKIKKQPKVSTPLMDKRTICETAKGLNSSITKSVLLVWLPG